MVALAFGMAYGDSSALEPVIKGMVLVNGGTFTMGCTEEQQDRNPDNDCYYDEKPAHKVEVGSFYISKYPVTQKQWFDIMGTTAKEQRDKTDTQGPLAGEGDNNPMYYVSWNEAQDFIGKLNAKTGKKFRLPTEAEWEYAARGGSKSKGYKYSGSNNIEEVAWYKENSCEGTFKNKSCSTRIAGKKKPNELGIYDMSGNVWEWTNSNYGGYSSSSQTNPRAPRGCYVCRGGAFYLPGWMSRVSIRDCYKPGDRFGGVGFRIVMEP